MYLNKYLLLLQATRLLIKICLELTKSVTTWET